MIGAQEQQFFNSLSKISQFFESLKNEVNSTTDESTTTQPLRISNSDTRYKLIYGADFKDMLDPRDVVLQHTFDFKVLLTEAEIKKETYNFMQSSHYADIVKELKKFLLESVSNVVSISFKNLNDGKLQQKEALNYAAQNIMLNIHSVFSKICKSIQASPTLTDKIKLQELKTDLISKIQVIINSILINLADNYPQAPVTGGTPRMNNVINEINRTDDEANDLIFSNNIKISNYLKTKKIKNFGIQTENIDFQFQQEDYTEFIMEVVNTVIHIVQSNDYDERQRTIKQIFTQFNQELFSLSQNQNFQQLINKLRNDKQMERQKGKEKEAIVNSFLKITQTSREKYQKLACESQKQHLSEFEQRKKNHQSRFGKPVQQQPNELDALIEKVNNQREKGIQHLRKDKKYAIAEKIPSYVKKFSRQEVNDKKFTAKHSSVLRILTKWAEYLEDIFYNAEKHLLMRLYPFKTIHNELCQIEYEQDKNILIQRLRAEFREVKLKLKIIKQKNIEFISDFMSKQSDGLASNVSRYAQTRAVSSKINAVLTSLMVDYLSILIHHLLKAGEFEGSSGINYNLNLIVFRVSDIMRAKFKCDESTFITLLKTIYLLDEHEQMQNGFRLVRIKNKLDDSANNIMINYTFMGRVLCQLQLSIQESKGKEKNYYIFSHFVYELTRGKFGAISECAIMISQLDPMVNACDKLYYVQKVYKQKKVSQPEMILRMLSKRQSLAKPERMEKLTFQCKKCQALTINQEFKLFKAQEEKHQCIKCIIAAQDCQKMISDTLLRDQLLKNIELENIKRISKFSEVKCTKDRYSVILNINSKGLLQMNLLLFRKPQLRFFLVKINSSVLRRIYDKNFEFKKVDYVDITPQYRNKTTIDELMCYESLKYEKITEGLYRLMGVQSKELLEHLSTFVRMFEEFRQEKTLIKAIKFKTEIIKCSQDKQKWQNFKKVAEVYSSQIGKKDNLYRLKYRKYHYLDFSKIKVIQLNRMQLAEFPELIANCQNLEELLLNNNKFERLRINSKLEKLKNLEICKNRLQNINDIIALPNLGSLNLSNNNLKDLNGLSKLQNLTNLYVNSNKLQNLQGLSTVSNLTTLHAKNNKLSNTKGLSRLINITQLNLRANNLSNIDELAWLTNLQQIDMSSNNLYNASALSNLLNLTSLNLCNNHLKDVNDLANLTRLQNLELSFNHLQCVNGLSNLVNITNLTLSSNRIQNISSLRHLLSLINLDLSLNKVQNVESLSNLINLVNLDLRVNKIQDITALHSLVNLKSLILSSNSLNDFCSFQTFKSLNFLDVLDNKELQIADMPLSLRFLSSNFSSIQNVDFKPLHNLREIKIKGEFKPSKLKNLSEIVKVQGW